MVATGQTVITNTGALSCQNAFAIGQDLECFANKTDLLLSGMNTLTSQIFFEANIGWGIASQAPTVAFTLDYYANYDLILVLDSGILTAKFKKNILLVYTNENYRQASTSHWKTIRHKTPRM